MLTTFLAMATFSQLFTFSVHHGQKVWGNILSLSFCYKWREMRRKTGPSRVVSYWKQPAEIDRVVHPLGLNVDPEWVIERNIGC